MIYGTFLFGKLVLQWFMSYPTTYHLFSSLLFSSPPLSFSYAQIFLPSFSSVCWSCSLPLGKSNLYPLKHIKNIWDHKYICKHKNANPQLKSGERFLELVSATCTGSVVCVCVSRVSSLVHANERKVTSLAAAVRQAAQSRLVAK